MRSLKKQRGFLGFLGGLLTAAAPSIVGGLIGKEGQSDANDTNVMLARENREFNAAEAQKNRDFQAEMSNSAYQRAVSDMRKAGLSPMLAYAQGGAGTPGGSAASAQAARVENENAIPSQLIGQIRLQNAQVENLNAQTAASAAQAAKTIEETKNVPLEGQRITQDTTLKQGQYGLTASQTLKAQTEINELVERMKQYPLNRLKVGEEVNKIVEEIGNTISLTNLNKQRLKTELEETALRGLSVQHSKFGLDESKASSAFFKEGAIGEQNKALRLIVDTLKGAAAAGSSWRK